MTDAPRWRRYRRFWGSDPVADLDDELTFHLECWCRSSSPPVCPQPPRAPKPSAGSAPCLLCGRRVSPSTSVVLGATHVDPAVTLRAE